MIRILALFLISITLSGCNKSNIGVKRIVLAQAGNQVLYMDEIPSDLLQGISGADSTAFVQNYINRWAKRELTYQKAMENITPEKKNEIEEQLNESRINLVIYEYQRQMMLQKMDTVISDTEMESYYASHESSFILTSNIVKAIFIKLPVSTPNITLIRTLSRSSNHNDMQQLESLCYQFAEKFDDFNEEWVSLDRLSVELNKDIVDQENFLRKNTYYESDDSSSVYLITIIDYRLRGSLAPFDYVNDDIKRIIWNNRRIEFIRNLQNGIYSDAVKENGFKTY